MAQAVAFFVDVLGCTVLETTGITQSAAAWGGTVEATMLRYDAHTLLELLHFEVPGQNTARLTMTDRNGFHLALTVGDLDAAIAYLAAQPGVVIGTPDMLAGGRRRVFWQTPWGMPMQLITPVVDRIF